MRRAERFDSAVGAKMSRPDPRRPAVRRDARPTLVRLLAAGLMLGLTLPGPLVAQEDAAPGVRVKSVRVTPDAPTADTLCHLEVELENRGDETASQLAFTVTIEGRDVDVYDNQIFMFPVAAGETSTLELFNFWVTETYRPAPTDGRLDVVVRLDEAQWYSIEEDDEGEVWEPLGAVPGLPTEAAVTVALAAAKSTD